MHEILLRTLVANSGSGSELLQSHQPRSTSDWDVPRTLLLRSAPNSAPRKLFCQAILMILLVEPDDKAAENNLACPEAATG
jgi:hypothetical protein